MSYAVRLFAQFSSVLSFFGGYKRRGSDTV
jgi:hypothetical protein